MTTRRTVLRQILGHVSLNGLGFIKLGEKVLATREARRIALSMPRGFEIPERPIPATRAEREAELRQFTHLTHEALEASLSLTARVRNGSRTPSPWSPIASGGLS